jgi:hypothetical protein
MPAPNNIFIRDYVIKTNKKMQPKLATSIADPVPLTPRSGMGKKSRFGSEMIILGVSKKNFFG